MTWITTIPATSWSTIWLISTAQKILWARSKGAGKDSDLCQAYSDRTFWSLQTDDASYSLKPLDLCPSKSSSLLKSTCQRKNETYAVCAAWTSATAFGAYCATSAASASKGIAMTKCARAAKNSTTTGSRNSTSTMASK